MLKQGVWCLNLRTGEVFFRNKWRDFYEIEDVTPKHGWFIDRCTIGVQVDMDRGIINFFKDSIDLGQACLDPELKKGKLHPFIISYQKCEISIFHPFVYPKFQAPEDESIIEPPIVRMKRDKKPLFSWIKMKAEYSCSADFSTERIDQMALFDKRKRAAEKLKKKE